MQNAEYFCIRIVPLDVDAARKRQLEGNKGIKIPGSHHHHHHHNHHHLLCNSRPEVVPARNLSRDSLSTNSLSIIISYSTLWFFSRIPESLLGSKSEGVRQKDISTLRCFVFMVDLEDKRLRWLASSAIRRIYWFLVNYQTLLCWMLGNK